MQKQEAAVQEAGGAAEEIKQAFKVFAGSDSICTRAHIKAFYAEKLEPPQPVSDEQVRAASGSPPPPTPPTPLPHAPVRVLVPSTALTLCNVGGELDEAVCQGGFKRRAEYQRVHRDDVGANCPAFPMMIVPMCVPDR
eukprot:SAG31_NODE_6172_length_2137_cov_2.024031_2_plen_138_part_00